MTKNIHGARAFKYFVLRQKYFFDIGFGVTNYFKYVIAFFGLASKDAYQTLIVAIIYAISCYFIGRWWIKNKMADIDNDIRNQYNPFVKDTLKLLSKNKKFK